MHTKNSSARLAGEVGQRRPWPERFATDEPTKAVAAAFGVGLLFNLLPIGRIVGMLIDLVFALVRPLLLCAGLLKLCEFCRSGSLIGGTTETKPPTEPAK